MADLTFDVRGALVAATAKPYSFKGRDGSQVDGVARRLWVVSDFTAEPVEVRLSADQFVNFEQAVAGGPGSPVALRCEQRANVVGDRAVQTVHLLSVIERAKTAR